MITFKKIYGHQLVEVDIVSKQTNISGTQSIACSTAAAWSSKQASSRQARTAEVTRKRADTHSGNRSRMGSVALSKGAIGNPYGGKSDFRE
jgi:hypothetical protein